jgi:hypothetical protein
MASKLANETLTLILEYALAVEFDLFASTSSHYTNYLSSRRWRGSAILVVCKLWMRIATPALFRTVIICRSSAALILADTLKKNPDFGGYTRQVRVEGGFGGVMRRILAKTPNVEDLCLRLDLASSDNVMPLLKAIDSLEIRRLALSSVVWRDNAQFRAAEKTLGSLLPKWTSLV